MPLSLLPVHAATDTVMLAAVSLRSVTKPSQNSFKVFAVAGNCYRSCRSSIIEQASDTTEIRRRATVVGLRHNTRYHYREWALLRVCVRPHMFCMFEVAPPNAHAHVSHAWFSPLPLVADADENIPAATSLVNRCLYVTWTKKAGRCWTLLVTIVFFFCWTNV